MSLTIAALLLVTWLALVLFFTPRIDYRVTTPLQPDTDLFLSVITATCQASVHDGNRVDILTNGAEFYPAMRDAMLLARSSINVEAYIFQPGRAADMLIDAMVARAREGVEVRLVLDSIGSAGLRGLPLRRLRDAGCHVHFYQPIRWYRLHRINNRTHRELLIVDGRVAFAGGAGIADWWFVPVAPLPAWRDTMIRVEGPVVASLQGVFAENWLECAGDVLTSPREWPALAAAGTARAAVVKSSPSDRVTPSRIFFQLLIEGAAESIDISTPYLLPDRALRRALVGAVQRGVHVRIIVPGARTDQRLVRLASRRLYGELLAGGVQIFEYEPAMTHVKALIVDRTWAVIGTTNLDNRSFEHNDEVNVAFRDAVIAARIRQDFEADLAVSDEVTRAIWEHRPPGEKLAGLVCWILERQQ